MTSLPLHAMLMPAGLFPTQDTRDVVYAPGSVCVWHIRSGNPTGVTLTIDASSMMPGDMLLVAGSFEPATGLSSSDKVVSDAWTLFLCWVVYAWVSNS